MRIEIYALALGAAVSLGAAFAVGINPAAASGGLSCSAGDGGVTVELEGNVTRGMGGPLFGFNGTVTIKDNAVAEDLRNTKFALDHVAQYWLDGKDLRLGLYRERDADKPHGYVQVDVLTQNPGEPDEGMYEGTFTLTAWDTTGDGDPKEFHAEGKIECFSE
jgi:hypothetical protein